MGRKHLTPESPACYGAQKVRTHDVLDAGCSYLAPVRLATQVRRIQPTGTASGPASGRSPRGPPFTHRQGRWVAPSALIIQHAVRYSLRRKGISRVVKTVYYQSDRSGNLPAAAVFAGPAKARTMTGILALGCFVTGFIAAWLLRTSFVMTQISWAQEQMERKVRYWQSEAIHARAVAEHTLRQLAAETGRDPEPTDWPGPDNDWRKPDMN
jgi:hypothetical protein